MNCKPLQSLLPFLPPITIPTKVGIQQGQGGEEAQVLNLVF